MKPLILSFFAVILIYSLCTDKEEKAKDVAFEKNSTIKAETVNKMPNQKIDTVAFYASKAKDKFN